MKQRKIPMRKCVVTKEQFPKKELIRIVKNKENEIFVDSTGKINGRGAYIQLNKKVIDKAKKSKILNKHLDIDVPEHIYEELYSLLNKGD
ncbi:YlxR family protein [Mycoplasmatota bacterium]|nr:YlxR family protein [Mycoplasmatota bacterium]